VIPREGLERRMASHCSGPDAGAIRTQARLNSGMPLIGS
jgi:hypothetical protein